MAEPGTAESPRPARRIHDQVQLVTYANRLGGSLPALARLLEGPLAGLFGGVHLLPFFLPYDGADAGFDPVDHLTVDPRLGGWEDVRRLGRSFDVVADVIVNHISDRSRAVQDVVEQGHQSPYAGMLLTFDRVFPAGATEEDLIRIVRPRPGLPFTPMVLGGRRRLLWTTFTSHQIDLDVQHPGTRTYLSEILHRLARSGVAMVRLDAVGYTVKTAGSSCFLTPETMRFVAELTDEARRLGLEVLAEVHAHRRFVMETARQVDWVYDFVLAPLILHGLFTGDSAPLRRWLLHRPANCLTALETHDGIGLLDAAAGPGPGDTGLLSTSELEMLVSTIHRNSGGTSVAGTVPGRGLYQVSCTAYDALGRDDRRYLLARLLQLFAPGISQVYYVGLLAGRNQARTSRAGDPREINRRSYSDSELSQALRQPVVQALLRLIRLRNTHPAFGGAFSLPGAPEGELRMAWHAGEASAELWARLTDAAYRLTVTGHGPSQTVTDVAALAP